MGQDPLRSRGARTPALWQQAARLTACARSARSTWRCGTSPARSVGQPIHRLLGTYREIACRPMRARPCCRSPQAYAEEALRVQGVRAGPPTRSIRRPQLADRHQGVRGGAQGGRRLHDHARLDLGLRLSRRRCASAAPIEEMGYFWYEDPLHDQDIYNYVKLKQQLDDPDPRHRVPDRPASNPTRRGSCCRRPTSCAATSR